MFAAGYDSDFKSWDYILGDPIIKERSIALDRYKILQELNDMSHDTMVMAIRDPEKEGFTKWVSFNDFKLNQVWFAYEVHRSLIENEIVIESDYPTYEENYDSINFIGTLLEGKGFIPHYYYGGGKSIHCHVFLDFTQFLELPQPLQDKILAVFKRRHLFVPKFMEFVRTKMISCWGMNNKKFDKDLIKERHLIRSEMSRNKKGYKTFLGYHRVDVPPIPIICNEDNRIYPELGVIRLSRTNAFQDLVVEFFQEYEHKKKKAALKAKERSLQHYDEDQQELLGCVKFLLSDAFSAFRDGRSRAMFILCNELKKHYGIEQAKMILMDWNARIGDHITEQEIDYRLRSSKSYTITCDYMDKFLQDFGITFNHKECRNHKVYK